MVEVSVLAGDAGYLERGELLASVEVRETSGALDKVHGNSILP